MMPEDLIDLSFELAARGDILFLTIPMTGPEPRIEPDLGPLPGDFGCRYLVRPQELKWIQIVHVPTTGKWTVVASKSPVIEFSRCRFDDSGALRSGRLYFRAPGYDFHPPPTFVEWADHLLKWMRKKTTYRLMKEPSHKGQSISNRAADWRDQGGVLGGA